MAYHVFNKARNFIKKTFKADCPLSIRRVHLNGFDGVCELKKDKFIIKINKILTESHSIDVMLHETAHALSWEKEEDFHGPLWGKTYAKVYNIFLKGFIEKYNK